MTKLTLTRTTPIVMNISAHSREIINLKIAIRELEQSIERTDRQMAHCYELIGNLNTLPKYNNWNYPLIGGASFKPTKAMTDAKAISAGWDKTQSAHRMARKILLNSLHQKYQERAHLRRIVIEYVADDLKGGATFIKSKFRHPRLHVWEALGGAFIVELLFDRNGQVSIKCDSRDLNTRKRVTIHHVFIHTLKDIDVVMHGDSKNGWVGYHKAVYNAKLDKLIAKSPLENPDYLKVMEMRGNAVESYYPTIEVPPGEQPNGE